MSVAKSSFIFSAGTLISRLSGVLRESVIGAVFGAGIYLDAYLVAFRIPNLLRDLLAEGALGSSFTKVYSSLCVENEDAASKLLIQTIQFVVMVSIVICGLGILLADDLVQLMTLFDSASQTSDFREISTTLTKVLFPFIGFAALGAVIQGALYQRGGFFLAGVAPILFNVFSIIGALWLTAFFPKLTPTTPGSFVDPGILGLAVGTLIGGAAQAGIQAWGIWKPLIAGKRLWPKSLPWSSDVKKVLVLMTPMVIAASAGQVNAIVNTNFATSLGPGAVTWISFAFRLVQLPIGMFGVAIGAAVLPALSKSITQAKGKVDAIASREVINAMDLVAWLMIPCTLALSLSSTNITRILYEAGRFTASDTAATAIAIEAYSYGLIGYGLLKVMNSYYYATGRTKFPMIISLISIIGNYAANAMLVHEVGHRGLALTASIMLTFNASMLIIGMAKDRVQVNWKQLITSATLLVTGSVVVITVHNIYSPLTEKFSIGLLLGISPGNFLSKIDSVFRLSIDTITIVGFFGIVGLARIKKTPKEALRMLKRRRT